MRAATGREQKSPRAASAPAIGMGSVCEALPSSLSRIDDVGVGLAC